MSENGWDSLFAQESRKPYWAGLQTFVAGERTRHRIYPPEDEVFTALHLTPYVGVKVVILGQDPYPGAGQAHGLCFRYLAASSLRQRSRTSSASCRTTWG
jgi:uracil-DNA glycosylase